MSGADDSLFGALARVAVEAGKTLRQGAEVAAKELSGALGADEMRWPAGLLGAGPVIPAPYKQPGQGITWQDGYMASCVVSAARAVQQHDLQPITSGLVVMQAALHGRPEGYRLLQAGLNSQRVLERGEWRRLVSSPLLHADLPHLVSNMTGLVLEGLPLEARLGSLKFAALVASTAAVSQGLYLLCTRLAADWLPRSSLATDYFRAYGVGFSGVALALKVVAGYMREADLAAARVDAPEEFVLTAGRLAAWPSLIMSHYLVPKASLAGHICGVAAGLIHVYGARLLSWLTARLRRAAGQPARRRLQGGRLQPAGVFDLGSAAHPGLGWMDVGSHVLLGTGCVLMAVMAQRREAR